MRFSIDIADSYSEPLDTLSGDCRNEVEVLADVEHGESGELSSRRDKQVGDRWCSMLAAVGKQHLDFDGSCFDCRRDVHNGHG